MKRLLSICALLVCCYSPALSADILPLVEINIQILNCGKSAKLIYNNEKTPYIIPEDGKLTFLAFKGDVITLEIHNMGQKPRDYTVYTDGLTYLPDEAVPFRKNIKFDFKGASYFGYPSNRSLFFDENALNPADRWILGRTIDKETGKRVSGVSLGLAYSENDSLVRMYKRNSNESGGFALSCHVETDIFLIAEKPGYYPAVIKIDKDELENSIPLEKTSYLEKNIEIKKGEFDDRFLSFVICKQENDELDLVKGAQVLNLPSETEINLGNTYVHHEFLDGRNSLDMGFLNPGYGFNRISVKTDYKNITCDYLYGKGDSKEAFTHYFSSLIFVPLNNIEDWKFRSLSEMMSGRLSLYGKISHSINGLPTENTRISLNDNEWVTFSDEMGKYQFEKIPAKDYSMLVHKNGYESYNVDILLNDNRELDVALKPLPDYNHSTVKGVLVSSDRHPVAGYRLRLMDTELTTQTDSSGSFVFKNLPEGIYKLCSSYTNYLGQGFYLQSDTTVEDTLFLHEGIIISDNRYQKTQMNQPYLINGILSGKLLDERNMDGIKDVEISIDGTMFHTTTDRSGEFVFPTLQTGYYDLSCQSDQYKTLQIDSVFHSIDRQTNVYFTMEYTGTSDQNISSSNKTISDSTVQESYGKVTSSKYNLNSRIGKITGQVVSLENNEPILGANILIEGTNKGVGSGNNGEFVIFAVKPGKYRITASSTGFSPATIEIELIQFQSLECLFNLVAEEGPVRKRRGGWCPIE